MAGTDKKKELLKQNYRNEVSANDTSFGYVPPQARDMEEAVIGACLLEKTAYERVAKFLKPAMFYVDANRIIFECMGEMVKEYVRPDLLLLVEYLNQKGMLDQVGGMYYCSKTTNAVVSTANLEKHAAVIYQKYAAREVIRLSRNIIDVAYRSDVVLFDALDEYSEAFHVLTRITQAGFTRQLGDIVFEVIEDLDKGPVADGVSGIPTGFKSIDKHTAGWQPTDFIILAARPGMGKSALAAQFAYRPAYLYNIPTALFSLEMSSKQIVSRVISSENKILASQLKRRDLPPFGKEKIAEFYTKIAGVPMFLNDAPHHTLQSICIEIRMLVEKFGVRLILIDYLQLIGLSRDERRQNNSNRDQDIGVITGTLKQLAKDLDVPIIALSQLTRDTEKSGGNNRPKLIHLRESGNIEQDADVVMFLYREFYYLHLENPDMIYEPMVTKGADVTIAKQRNGDLEKIDLIWESKYVQFLDANDEDAIGLDNPF